MEDKSALIFGNPIDQKTQKKAQKNKEKYIKKFGDDSAKVYHLKPAPIPSLAPLGVQNLVLSEEEMKAIVAKFSTLVSDNGTLESVNEWGKRRLAYPINYIPEGYYVLVSYKSEPSFPREFERVLGITDGIIRSMTTKKIEGAPAPAVAAPIEVAEEAVEREAKAEEAPAKAEEPAEETPAAAEEAPAAETAEPTASEE